MVRKGLAPGMLAVALGGAAGMSGCLPPELDVDGKRLFDGRDLERPHFVRVEGVPWVVFDRRTSPAMPPRAGTYEVSLVAWDDGRVRRLVQNVSDRDSWRPSNDADGVRYYMTDEQPFDGAANPGGLFVATLVRLDLVRGELERIPEVVSSSVSPGLKAWTYQRAVPGARMAELHYRGPSGVDRTLGPSSGPAQLIDDETLYFVTGEDRTLSRITSMDGAIEPLRPRVTRFLLGGNGLAIVQVVEEGKGRTVVFDLETRRERTVPGENPCCWLGLFGDEFVYSEAASSEAPARLHAFHVRTGEDRVLTMPAGLADVSSTLGRPGSDEVLLFDSRGRVARHRPSLGEIELLDIRPVTPSFTPDGRFFVYLEREVSVPVPEGRLVVREADFSDEPRTLSPVGMRVPQGGYFFLADGEQRILVFWAHFGRGPSNLFFADPASGVVREVAEGISEVSVTPRRVLGIVRVSQQDLVGDLVQRDIATQTEQILAHRVADAAFFENRVAFIVRERVPSDRDGLWATCIAADNDGDLEAQKRDRQTCLGQRLGP